MFISPMLLEYAADNKPFNSKDYITELKLDGIRLIASKNENRVRLYTRHNNEITANFPELVDDIKENVPDGTILDGELIVTGKDGKPDFEAMMERFKSRKSKHKATFCVFDIIRYKNNELKDLPLIVRKEALETSFSNTDNIVKSQFLVGKAEEYFSLVKNQQLEGIVMKKADSRYEIDKRSSNWKKVIAYDMDEFYIAGYKKDEFGWLLSDGEKILGVMELGVGEKERKAGYKIFQQLKTGENNKTVYIKPVIKVVVKYRGYYKSGMLRLPVFEYFKV
ncbi:RNA ligase family protein [Paenibacillus sp. Marseille-Q4541]|uniref:ATP-dependent DNA ligase n=1 Tax=Paenibacillus sp. Marseille-Q4541 TaxID=2831522 RepID=UPI001BAD0662|nr:RNA ligase family protein [Paenibacillus sp. Marseille-Q4541]